MAYYDLKTGEVKKVPSKFLQYDLTFIYGGLLQDGSIVFSNIHGAIFKIVDPLAENIQLVPLENIDPNSAYPLFHQAKNGLIYACENLNRMVVFHPDFTVKQTAPISGDFKCFYEEANDSILWIGTDRGLIRYHTLDNRFRIFKEEDGLPNAMIQGIVPDKKGNLWLSSSSGLSRFNPQTKAVKNFTVFDGLTYKEFNNFSYFGHPNGEIYFGSINGLTVFDPENLKINPYVYQPLITDIKINDEYDRELQCAKTKATNPSEVEALELDYNKNTISFEFSAMDYGDPENNQYKYRMTGEDEKWIEAGTRDFARYSNLKPGDYEFLIHASNSDGVWSTTPTALAIKITPPIWMRTWFLSLLTAFAIILLWLLSKAYYKYKYDKQLALEKQKLFWARKMHEDLGADYSSLKLRLEVLLSRLTKQKELIKETDRISNLSQTVSKQIRGIIWSLNYKNDFCFKLLAYLQEYATSVFDDTSVELHFPLPLDLPKKVLKGEIRMTVLHVFKEALNNILKHAKADQVNISLELFPSKISILIRDNGHGFDPKLIHSSTGNGLTNMQERMKEIAGSCEIKTSNHGTSILLSFPF